MKIIEYLDKRHMKQTDFANKIGVSKEALRHYIKGNCYPPLPVAQKIIEATNGEIALSDLVNK